MPSVDSIEPGLLHEEVMDALRGIADPCSIATGRPIDLVDMGLIREVRIDGPTAVIELRLTSPVCFQAANIVQRIELDVRSSTGLRADVHVDDGAEWMPTMMSADAREELRRVRPWPPAQPSPGRSR